MQTIACDQTTLDIELQPCAGATAADYSATLTRALCAAHTLVVAYVAATPTAGARLRLTLPTTALRRGVWMLSVTTPCGCRNAPLFFEGCAPLAMPGEHLPTRDTPTPVPVSCAPELQPDLEAANPVLGFDFARSANGLVTGIDTDELYGEPIEPAPTYTGVAIVAAAAGLTMTGSFAPAPAGLDGDTWRLLDRYGRELATGALTVTAGVASFTGELADPLGCGPHYLTLEETP